MRNTLHKISTLFSPAPLDPESVIAQRRLLPWYGLLLLFLVPIYYKTLLPGVGFWGDSANYQFVGLVLGTPHSPGNPLYVLLNRLFMSLVPFGSAAWRSNLLSMLFSLAASLAFFYLLVLVGIRPVISFVTTMTFALTYGVWLNSLVTEVYIACLFSVVMALVFLLLWRKTKRDRYLYLACLVYALSYGFHLMMLVMLPAFVFMVWAIDRRVFLSWKKILIVTAIVALGVAQYLYIVWRTNDPNTVFLGTNTQSMIRFIRYPILETVNELSPSQVFQERVAEIPGFFWDNFYFLVLFSVLGIFMMKDRLLNITLLILLVTTIVFIMQLEIAEVVGIYLPAFMVAAIYLGSALEWIARRFFRHAYLSWVFLILPIFMFSMNFARVDQSKHVLHAQVVEGILKKADHDALIIADNYEYASYIYYYLFAEGHAKRNLYTIADFNIKPEQVLAYLKGEKPIEIYQQRLTLPYGLRVYVMKVPAARFDVPGLTLKEVGKSLYEITPTD